MVQLAVWIGIAVSLFFCALAFIGARLKEDRRPKLPHFLVCSKELKRHHFFATLSASNAALANILFLFAYWGFRYGAWAWFWGGIFWGAGLLFFVLLMKHSSLPRLIASDRPELGLNEIVGRYFNSSRVLVASAIVSALAFLWLLTLELNVGSKLFAVFIPQSTALTPYVLALGFGLLLAFYASWGGFPMVVRTDMIQLILVLGACISIPLCVTALLPGDQSWWTLVENSFRTYPAFKLDWDYIPFITGSLFSWGVWFVCTMDMWQRSLAIEESKAKIGLWGVLPSYVVLLLVTGVGVLAGIYVREATGATFERWPLIRFVDLLSSSATSNIGLAIGLGFIVAGFMAALLSTVDTYLIIVAHSIRGDIESARHGWLSDLAKNDEDDSKYLGRIRVCTAALPIAAIALFWISTTAGEQDTFTLYMIAGSIPMALFPVCLAIAFEWPMPPANRVAIFMVGAAIIGMIINFYLANTALSLAVDPERYLESTKYFGLIYYVPALVSFLAALPFLGLIRRQPHV